MTVVPAGRPTSTARPCPARGRCGRSPWRRRRGRAAPVRWRPCGAAGSARGGSSCRRVPEQPGAHERERAEHAGDRSRRARGPAAPPRHRRSGRRRGRPVSGTGSPVRHTGRGRPSRSTATSRPIDNASACSWVTRTAVVSWSARARPHHFAGLGPQRGVEARERLVEQYEAGSRRQRPRQRHPPLLTAREFLRTTRRVALVETDELEHFRDARRVASVRFVGGRTRRSRRRSGVGTVRPLAGRTRWSVARRRRGCARRPARRRPR